MNVIMLPIAELTPHPENPRRHPQRELEDLRESLRLYGFVRNIVVAQDKVILCGHGMVEAARQNGLTEAPCEVVKLKSTHPKAKKLMLLDNQVSRNAEDCDETIAALLAEIELSGEGLPGTGYTAEEVDELIRSIAGDARSPAEEDEAPEPLAEAISKPGDVWLCGRHRVMCGDCTEAAVWGSVPKGCFMLTDPPYSVQYASRAESPDANQSAYHESADALQILCGFLGASVASAAAMTYPVDRHFQNLASAIHEAGWELRKECVWVKQTFTFWPGAHYQQRHEPIWQTPTIQHQSRCPSGARSWSGIQNMATSSPTRSSARARASSQQSNSDAHATAWRSSRAMSTSACAGGRP